MKKKVTYIFVLGLFIILFIILFENTYIFKKVDGIKFFKNKDYYVNEFNSLKVLEGVNNDFYILYSDIMANNKNGDNELNIIYDSAFKEEDYNKYDVQALEKRKLVFGKYTILFFPEIKKILDESIKERIIFKNKKIYIFYPEFMSKNGDYGKLYELNDVDFLNNLQKNVPYITLDK